MTWSSVRLLAAGCSALIGLTAASFGAEDHPHPLPFSWMAGCWEMHAGTRVVEEQWMAPRGEIMLGMSRTSVNGEVRGYEHMSIRAEGDGFVFEAHPSGQASAEFRSLELTSTSVIFANPEHDFPQRIIYWSAAGGDSLLARIEGALGGRERAIDFPYGRADCPAP